MIYTKEWAHEEEGVFEDYAVYSDGLGFERVVDMDLSEEDDMDASDAAFMKGYFDEEPPYIYP